MHHTNFPGARRQRRTPAYANSLATRLGMYFDFLYKTLQRKPLEEDADDESKQLDNARQVYDGLSQEQRDLINKLVRCCFLRTDGMLSARKNGPYYLY